MKVITTTLFICIVMASTYRSANASGNDVITPDCKKACTQAASLFWDTYNATLMRETPATDDPSLVFLSKYDGIPKDIEVQITAFAKEMFAKYGRKLLDHKQEVTNLAESSCMKGCKSSTTPEAEQP